MTDFSPTGPPRKGTFALAFGVNGNAASTDHADSMHGSDSPDAIRTRTEKLRQAIRHAAHLLPAQGPIQVFIHHNTLHAFEEIPFEKAVQVGGTTFGCQPFWSEDRYRDAMARGRIHRDDIAAVLMDDLDDEADRLVGLLGTRFHLRLVMLQYPLRLAPGGELRWFIAETAALKRFRDDVPLNLRKRVIEETRHWVMRDLRNGHSTDVHISNQRVKASLGSLLNLFGKTSLENWTEDKWESFCLNALWRACHQGVHGLPLTTPTHHRLRHRDWLLAATGEDSDRLVHETLIPFVGAFLDQGMATWTLPGRESGFFESFATLYRQAGGPPEAWLAPLRQELQRLQDNGIKPIESVAESLDLLGVAGPEQQSYIEATLLALRGWAGMVWQTESRADRARHPAPEGSLIGFLAIHLLLDRLALSHLARTQLGFKAPLRELEMFLRSHVPRKHPDVDERAFLIFQLAQVLGWNPADLYRLAREEWQQLLGEVEAFHSVERRRIFHLAYERRYQIQTLDAVRVVASRKPSSKTPPNFQIVCCIDEREESFRRHIEEVDPLAETFGAAGFFGVAMYYRGAADAHYVPLCPLVIVPRHYVQEVVDQKVEVVHRRRGTLRRWLGTFMHRVHVGSRTLAGGAMLTGLLGPLASIPLVFGVLFPRLTSQTRRLANRFVQPPDQTDLILERSDPEPGPGKDQLGYTVEEMAQIVERLLRDIGLTSDFARLVMIAGHGSSSLNNPHESAYNCGACGGNRGGPNARAFVRMANDPRIRSILSQRGLAIPSDTIFLAVYHNTCDDSITFIDRDRLPPSHVDAFAKAKRSLDLARRRNAHERCRRFESASVTLTPEAALEHVEVRADDLSQARPEYCHATNAICIVARRSRIQGLFLDRRAFLCSYDPTQDDAECTILTRILLAAVPVCAGINLEYYFSTVDPSGYGCGTKLPHNITSLLGVMDGPASDLRTGLPIQTTEIHEPLRLQFIIETTPMAAMEILDRNQDIARLVRNRWVHLATLDPESAELHLFQNSRFVPYKPETNKLPEVDSSESWYRGWRDHLGFARIRIASEEPASKSEKGVA